MPVVDYYWIALKKGENSPFVPFPASAPCATWLAIQRSKDGDYFVGGFYRKPESDLWEIGLAARDYQSITWEPQPDKMLTVEETKQLFDKKLRAQGLPDESKIP